MKIIYFYLNQTDSLALLVRYCENCFTVDIKNVNFQLLYINASMISKYREQHKILRR